MLLLLLLLLLKTSPRGFEEAVTQSYKPFPNSSQNSKLLKSLDEEWLHCLIHFTVRLTTECTRFPLTQPLLPTTLLPSHPLTHHPGLSHARSNDNSVGLRIIIYPT